jgi:hypothetical protein
MRTLYPSQVGVIDLARWSDLQLLASSRRCMIATIVGPGVQPIALISLACHNDDGPCWLLPLNLYILGFLLGMAQYKIFNTLAPGQRTTRSTDSVSQPPPTGFGGCGFVIFSFSYIFLSILQKYMVRNFFCKTIHLALWGTATGTYRRAPLR